MGITAVILAGGQGRRMGQLCQHRPKPALPFGGKYRVIDFALSNCVNSGIRDITVLADYMHPYMMSYARSWRREHHAVGHFRIERPQAGHFRGTADAVYQNIEYLKMSPDRAVLVLAADHIYAMDYRKVLAAHEKSGAEVTVCVTPVEIGLASQFGIIKTDSESRITDFIEKPAYPPSNLASMGIYIFNRQYLIDRLEADAASTTSSHDFGYNIIPEAVRSGSTFAYQFNGYWQDIGTPQAYLEANLRLTRPAATPEQEIWPIHTVENNLPDVPDQISGEVVDSIISGYGRIEGRVVNSVLSRGVHVAKGAVVRNSILMDNVSIGPGAVVCGAILDDGVIVGENGRVDQPEGEPAVIGKGTVVAASSYPVDIYIGYLDTQSADVPGVVLLQSQASEK